MKLLSKTTVYLSACFVLIMGVWAVLFYFSMLDEIYDSIDDGLDNYKLLILEELKEDSTILQKTDFNESNYSIKAIEPHNDRIGRNLFSDTLMFMRNEMDFEPVRLLRTDFIYGDNRYYQLQVISSMIEEDDLISDMLYYLIGLYLCIVISVILLNNFVLRRVWKPFYTLIDELRNFNLHAATLIRTPSTSITEFKLLNDTVVQLIQNNINVYNSQRQFIENASHELQTPLAVSITKLELLIEDENLTEQQSAVFSVVLNNLERLKRLNKALVLISKIENKQYANQTDISLNEIIVQMLAEFNELIRYHHIRVDLGSQSAFVHRMDPDLAGILISNILKNGIVHNRKDGLLRIQITRSEIRISNTSNSEPLNRNKLFTRFYKESENRDSTGLGLAISHSICTLSDLVISYSYEDGFHVISLKKR